MSNIDERSLLESELLYLYQVESAEKSLREKRNILTNMLDSYASLNKAVVERVLLSRMLTNFSYENANNNFYGKMYLEYLNGKTNQFAYFLRSIDGLKNFEINLNTSFYVDDRHFPRGKYLCSFHVKCPLFQFIDPIEPPSYDVIKNPIGAIYKASKYLNKIYSHFLCDKWQIVKTIDFLLTEADFSPDSIEYEFYSEKKGETLNSKKLSDKEKWKISHFFKKHAIKKGFVSSASSSNYSYYDFEIKKSVFLTSYNYKAQINRLEELEHTMEIILKSMPKYGFGYYKDGSHLQFGQKSDNPKIVNPVLDYTTMSKLYPFISRFLKFNSSNDAIKKLIGDYSDEIDDSFLLNRIGELTYSDTNKSKYSYKEAIKIFLTKGKDDKESKLKEAIRKIDETLSKTSFKKAINDSNTFPPYYSSADDIHYFMFLFFNKRADTVKELINLTEQIRAQEKLIGKLDQIQSSISDLSKIVKTGFSNVNNQLENINNKISVSLSLQKNISETMKIQNQQSAKTNQKLDSILTQNERHYLGTIKKLNELDESMKDIEEAIEDIDINYNFYEINNTYDYSTTNNYSANVYL